MKKNSWNKPLGAATSFALILSMTFGVSISSQDAAQAASKKPKLSSKKITVSVGKVKTIKVKPANKKVKWSVKQGKQCITLTNKKKASVGIRGKKAGKATVQAAVGAKKLACKVTVKKAVSTASTSPKPEQSVTPAQNTAAPANVPTAAPAGTPEPTESPSQTPTGTPVATPGEGEYEGTDISWIDPNKPMVAFTFDDGPVGNADTDNSMVIHNALREHNAHATFFYIGSQINSEAKRDEVKRAAEAGFEVGNHSYDWKSLSSLKEEAITESIDKTNAILTEITGYHNFLFRAPNLAVSNTMRQCINAPFIHCGVDSKDWDKATTENIIANVKKAKDGDIILMHETEKNTVAAVPELLDYFQEKDWQVVSVSELFLARGQKMIAGQDHHNCPPKQE